MCSPSVKERFNQKHTPITESGCWLWTAGLSADGLSDDCWKIINGELV